MAIDGAGILVMDSGAGGSFRPVPAAVRELLDSFGEGVDVTAECIQRQGSIARRCLGWCILLRGGLCSPMIMAGPYVFPSMVMAHAASGILPSRE